MTDADFDLGGIENDRIYEFTDADSNEIITLSGSSLLENSFKVHIPNKRESKLYFYKKS
jgi:hypothetical protein